MERKILLKQIYRETFNRSFYLFFCEFWDCISSEIYVNNWHIKSLCDELQYIGEKIVAREKTHNLLVNMPPGMSKSSIFSIMFPVWIWTKDASIQIISASYEENLATDFCQDSKLKIIYSDKFQWLYGKDFNIIKSSDAKKYYKTNKGGFRKAVGTKGNITGKHAHIFIIDDPMNPRSAQSTAERETVNKWLSDTVPTRKISNNTCFLMVMQRLHINDSTNVFLDTFQDVKHIVLPAILSDNISKQYEKYYIDGLLDIKRLPMERINELKNKRIFAGQFLQKPAPDMGNIINPDWFEYYNIQDVKNTNMLFCIDGAFTNKTKNDPSVIIAYFVNNNKIYLYDLAEIWLNFTDLLEFIFNFVVRNGGNKNSIIRIEPKANGKDLIDAIITYKGLNACASKTPTADKVQRVHSITPILESKRVLLPTNKVWTNKFLEQCKNFPNDTHDDIVDTLQIICEHFNDNNFIY